MSRLLRIILINIFVQVVNSGQLSLASLWSLNRVPASAGVRAGMSPLPGGR